MQKGGFDLTENNFIIELIARLNKLGSKKQIQTDAKNIGEIKIPLIGTLDKRRTKQQIKQDLSSINETVNLNGKVNKKGIVSSVQQATQQAQKKVNSQPVEINFSVKKEKLINDIKLLGQQNSRLFKDTGMTSKFNTLLDNAQLATNTQELNSLRLQLSAFRSELKVTGNIGMTFTDALKSGLSKVLQLFGGYNVIMQFTAQLRNAWKEAKELDSALTDLSRVNSEISRNDFPNYLDKIINKTKELSVATKDYIDAVTTFSRAGYNLTDSEILADAAMQLEKVGDMSSESASKALLSGLQGYAEIDGYGMDQLAEKAQALNDKIDIIGNTASISQKEVAEGIQAVGSVMSDANTSVDEFISLLGAANRTVQDSNKVALAIRTSALRIRGCTVELEEMGETTDGVIESTSTLAAKIKALTNINGSGGVNILEADEETFRSIYDIYNDIAKVYDKMSDKNAAALLELIAGKNRSNQISAVLNNMSEANELLDRSLNAAGTASNEYQIYLDSAEAATERFGVAMTETYNNILNGETVKSLANAGIAVLDFANNFGIVEGTIKGFLALGILKGITTLTMAFKNSAVQVNNYGIALSTVNKLETVRGTQKYAESMNILKTSCIGLTEVRLKQVLANKALGESERVAILMERGLTQEQAQAILVQMGLTQTTNAQTTANGAATASTFSLKAAIIGLGASIKTAFLSNPVGIGIMAISTTIGFATSALSKHNQAVEELRQRTKEAADNANILSNEISELTNKYISLSEAVKTDECAKEDLISTQTELLKKLGLEGENIDDLTSKYGSLSNAIKQASINSLKNSQIDLIAGVDSAREELLEVAKDNFWGTNNIINVTGEDAVKAFKELEKAGIISDGSYGSAGGSLVLIGDKTIDGALENFTKLEDALTALRDSEAFTTEELSENSLYQAVYNRYSEMKNGVDYYRSAIENLNENLSQQTMLTALQGQEIPKTEKAFNIFRQELVNTAIASNQFIGNEKEITDAINSYLSTVPEFEGYYSIPLKNELDKVNELLGQENLSTSLSITDTVDQLNTQLKPTFDSLKSAYEDIFTTDDKEKSLFTLKNVDLSMLDSIKSAIDELNENKELGISIDYSSFENLAKTFTDTSSTADDVHDAFNSFATDIVNSLNPSLSKASGESLQLITTLLQSLGVINAEEVVISSLGYSYQQYITAKEECANTSLDLQTATQDEINAFVNEQIAAGTLGQALAQLEFNKVLVSNTHVETQEDINRIFSLAEAAGIGSEALAKLAQFKNDLANETDPKTRQWIVKSINEYTKTLAQEIKGAQVEYKAPATKSKKSGSKSQKDTNKEFDWIEQAIENAEKEVKKLEDIVNSAYSTFFEKSKALAQEIEKVNEEIGLQQQAYDEYMRKAESIELRNC